MGMNSKCLKQIDALLRPEALSYLALASKDHGNKLRLDITKLYFDNQNCSETFGKNIFLSNCHHLQIAWHKTRWRTIYKTLNINRTKEC